MKFKLKSQFCSIYMYYEDTNIKWVSGIIHKNSLILTSSSSAEFMPPSGTPVLRLPRPQGERRTELSLPASPAQPKSIDSPWGWGKTIDFQAFSDPLLNIPDTHLTLNYYWKWPKLVQVSNENIFIYVDNSAYS